MRHIGDPDTSYPRDIANRFIPRSFVGLILVATWSTALAVPIRVQSHGVTLLIPKPVGISSASSRLTNGIQAVGVMPGEQLLALFVNRDKPGHSPPAIKMMQVVTSINGRHVPVSLRAFAKQNSKSKKAISAYKQNGVQRCRLIVDEVRIFGFICTPGKNDRFVTASVSILVKGLVIAVAASGVPVTNTPNTEPVAKEALKEAKAIIKANM